MGQINRVGHRAALCMTRSAGPCVNHLIERDLRTTCTTHGPEARVTKSDDATVF